MSDSTWPGATTLGSWDLMTSIVASRANRVRAVSLSHSARQSAIITTAEREIVVSHNELLVVARSRESAVNADTVVKLVVAGPEYPVE